MTDNNEPIKRFRRNHPMPDGVYWDEKQQRFETLNYQLGKVTDLYNELWELWNTKAGSDEDRTTLIGLGYCPDCGQIPEMDEEGPFSHCGCGTSEDYADRPLQKKQLLEREVAELRVRLREIEELGHGWRNGSGRDCADKAEEALKLGWGRSS